MYTVRNVHKKRIQWLDFIKGICILFVVIGHSIFATQNFPLLLTFTSVAMPIFFVVSGYLYRPSNSLKKYRTLLYKKASGFIIPYFIFTYIFIFSQNINGFLHLFKANGFKALYLPTGYVWFLYSLFFIFLLVGLMDLLHINVFIQIVISLIFYVFASKFPFIMYGLCHDVNPIPRMGSYMICFYIGYLIKRYNISQLLKRCHCTFIFAILLVLLLLIQNKIYGYLDVNNFSSNLVWTNIFIKIVEILFIFSLAVNFNEKNIIFRYFTKYGKGTLLIYLVHLPVIALLNRILINYNFFVNHQNIFMIIQFVIAWLVSVFIYRLSKEDSIINFIFYPRSFFDDIFYQK